MFKIIDKLSSNEWRFGFFLFISAFIFGPLKQLNFYKNMPGDVVDARLNCFFLENIYQYVLGQASSLIHLNIFYPYPYVSAFSDNLFGAAPIYLFARSVGLTPEGAFQSWFIVGYFANFIAANYAIRLFNQSRIGSAFGATLYTFGLPVVAQMGHAQLQYRFGLALAIGYFYVFLTRYSWRALVLSAFWLAWQFFCSIYMGFFASLFMTSMVLCFPFQSVHKRMVGVNFLKFHFCKFIQNYKEMMLHQKMKSLAMAVTLLVALLGLFYPYLKVTQLYKFTRTWVEVSAMLPRMSSYLLADSSLIWGGISGEIKGLPIRWEQQLFIGAVPLVLILFGAYLTTKFSKSWGRLTWLALALLALVLLTLNINNDSAWRLVAGLPLFSAIRAVSRIILLFLFPVSLFLAAAVDVILSKRFFKKEYVLAIIALPLLFEVSAVQANTSLKEEWFSRLKLEEARLPAKVSPAAILFFSQRERFFEREELDAMLAAQKYNLPTLNGYSGALPHHFRAQYGDDCAEYPRRIILYLDFMGEGGNKESYRQLAQRVVPIGFAGCIDSWRQLQPMTLSHEPLSRDAISALSLEKIRDAGLKMNAYDAGDKLTHIAIRIRNNGKHAISALSAVDQPLRLAWRIIDKNGLPKKLWTQPSGDEAETGLPQGYRRDLPGDIPAGGYVDILAPIPEEAQRENSTLEFTLVQEATLWGFSLNQPENIWAHDVGVTPLRMSLSDQ